MKLMKKFSKHIASVVCIILILTSAQITSLGCEVGAESKASEKTGLEVGSGTAAETGAEITTEVDSATQLQYPVPSTEDTLVSAALSVGEGSTVSSLSQEPVSDYQYEDEFMTVKVQAAVPTAIPIGATLKVRTIKEDVPELLETFNLVSNVLKETAAQNQFVVDGFMAYELYFECNGIEIKPEAGMLNATFTYKQELVPEVYKTSVQTGKEVKLFQLETIGQKVNAVDKKTEITKLEPTANGGVNILEFHTDKYEPFAIAWKEDVQTEVPKQETPKAEEQKEEQLSYSYADASLSAIAKVGTTGILPKNAKFSVTPITDSDCSGAKKLILEDLKKNGMELRGVLAYDYTFQVDGTVIQPKGEVTIEVTFQTPIALANVTATGSNVYFFHVKKDGNIENKKATVKANDDGTVSSISFTASEFSPYILASAVSNGEASAHNLITCDNFTNAGPLIRKGPMGARSAMNRGQMLSQSAKPRTGQTSEGLVTEKKASLEKDGTYKISLEAYVQGKALEVSTSVPTDIVLVLDQSGSMNYPMSALAGGRDEDFPKGEYVPKQSVDSSNTYYVRVWNGSKYEWRPVRSIGTDGWWRDPISRGDYYPTDSVNQSAGDARVVDFYQAKDSPRIDVLKQAVGDFVDQIQKDGTANHVNHRIAVAGFSSKRHPEPSYNNTELMTVSTAADLGYSVQYADGTNGEAHTITPDQYSHSLQDITTADGKIIVSNAVKTLCAGGATRADCGMYMAQEIFANNPIKNEVRNRVVVMFTDGEPTGRDGNGSEFDVSAASAAVEHSNKIKNTYGGTVYTVGVYGGADVASYNDGRINQYMNRVSSNYKNINDFNVTTGYIPDQSGYYLTAADSGTLGTIFEKISSQINVPTVTKLGEDAIIMDYISEHFKLGSKPDCKVYTSNYKGGSQWETPITVPIGSILPKFDPTNKTVSVTGFDFSKNFIHEAMGSEPAGGQKIIVEITVKREDGFIGGNQVPTNRPETAVTDGNGNVVENFPEPKVDVNLKYSSKTYDQSMYITEDWNDIEKFFMDGTGIKYKIKNVEYKVNGVNNKYVDITYEVKDADGKLIGNYIIPAGQTVGYWESKVTLNSKTYKMDQQFTINTYIETTEISLIGDEITERINRGSSKLYVFKPTIPVSDHTVFLGEKTKLRERVGESVWKNEEAEKAGITPESVAPTLTYRYFRAYKNSGGSEIPTQDGLFESRNGGSDPMDLKVYAGGQDISGSTTIYNTTTTHEAAYKPSGTDFTIYTVDGQMSIQKTINDKYTKIQSIHADQTFIFKIQRFAMDEKGNPVGKALDTFYETIHFNNKSKSNSITKKIGDLQKGCYVVTEETEWSTKYKQTKAIDTTLQIGKKTKAETDTQLPTFTGVDPFYTPSEDVKRPKPWSAAIKDSSVSSKATFENQLKDSTEWAWLSDTTSVVNQFHPTGEPM